MLLQMRGKQLASAIVSFHIQHNRWPATLSEVLLDGHISSDGLLYPRIYDLPDRRDLLGFTDGLEWIYIPPDNRRVGMPLLIAPLPYTASMGRSLARPRRIIVKSDTVPETVDEEEVAKLIRSLAKA